MGFWWTAAALAAGAAVLLLLSQVRVRVRYRREGRDDRLEAELAALFGAVRIRREIPAADLKPWLDGLTLRLERDGAGGSDEAERLRVTRRDLRRMARLAKLMVEHVKDFRDFLADTMRHVRVDEFQWSTRLGTGDAAETGLACGVLWGLKGAAAGAAGRWMTLTAAPRLTVAPAYDAPGLLFRTELALSARIRVLRLAAAAAMLALRAVRSRGGLRYWAGAALRGNGNISAARRGH